MTEEQKASMRNTDKFRKKLEYENMPEKKKTKLIENSKKKI